MGWMEGVPSGGHRGQRPGRAYISSIELFPSAVVEKHQRVDVQW